MAENLYATEPYWGTVQGVINRQNSLFGLSSDKEYSTGNIEKNLERLKKMSEVLREQEKAFYSLLGLPQGEMGLKTLQNRMDCLNADVGFRNMSTWSNSLLIKSLENPLSDGEFVDKIQLDFSKDKQFLVSFFNEKENYKEVEGVLMEFLSKLSKQKGIKVVQNRTAEGGQPSDLRQIKISSRNLKEGTITISSGQGIPKYWIDRLQKDFGAIIKGKRMVDPRTLIRDHASKEIADAKLRDFVLKEINNLQDYALSSNFKVIKGFLGEIKMNAFMKYITDGKGINVLPTGKVQNALENNLQISIDMVVENFGFQVKNYKLAKNKVAHFSGGQKGEGMSMTNFIKNRLRAEGSVEKILLDFFGSYQYNQPIPEPLYGKNEWENYRNNIFSRFKNEKRIKSVFDGYLDNIMRISQEIRNDKGGLFSSQDLYYNTFFIIADRFIPSSKIVEAIYNNLKNKLSSIQSSYIILEPNEKGERYPNQQGDYRFGKESTPEKLAEEIKIKYFIDLDLSTVLKEALDGLG